MGHYIKGLIARRETLRLLNADFPHQPSFVLAGGLAFLPLDSENLDDLVGLGAGKRVDNFMHLTERLIQHLCTASRKGELIYVETEYFGGVGGQGAAVFWNGTLTFGPKWGDHPINEALAKVGIPCGRDQIDEFATIGLMEYRSNEDFRERGTPA
jgi:hypothetical protein